MLLTISVLNLLFVWCLVIPCCAVLYCVVISISSYNFIEDVLFTIILDPGSDADSDVDDLDDATVMGSTVAYAEVEASIRALRYGSDERHQGIFPALDWYM